MAVAPLTGSPRGAADGTCAVVGPQLPRRRRSPRLERAESPSVALRGANSIQALAFLAQDKLVTGSADGALRVYDLKQPDTLSVIPSQGTHFTAIVTDGRRDRRYGRGMAWALVCDLEHTANPPRRLNGGNGAISVPAFAARRSASSRVVKMARASVGRESAHRRASRTCRTSRRNSRPGFCAAARWPACYGRLRWHGAGVDPQTSQGPAPRYICGAPSAVHSLLFSQKTVDSSQAVMEARRRYGTSN